MGEERSDSEREQGVKRISSKREADGKRSEMKPVEEEAKSDTMQ